MRHEAIEAGEVVLGLIAKQLRVRLFADADVQSKHPGAIQPRSVVEISIVLRDDGREGEAARPLEVAIGVVDEEGVAPSNFGGAALLRPHLDVNALKRVCDELGDSRFVQVESLSCFFERAL